MREGFNHVLGKTKFLEALRDFVLEYEYNYIILR